MEYFTLSEDLEEIQSAKNKLRTRILIGVVIVGSFFLLRSSGVINIEYNKAYFKGNHRTRKEIYEVYNDGAKGTINDNKKTGSLATDDKDSYFNLGISFKSGDPSQDKKAYLKELVREKLTKEKTLGRQFESALISVEKLEMSGGYWLPLIKSGKSSYRISVENKVSEDKYSADFSGETELEVYGICTISKLETIITEKIAKIVVDSIKEDYKK